MKNAGLIIQWICTVQLVTFWKVKMKKKKVTEMLKYGFTVQFWFRTGALWDGKQLHCSAGLLSTSYHWYTIYLVRLTSSRKLLGNNFFPVSHRNNSILNQIKFLLSAKIYITVNVHVVRSKFIVNQRFIQSYCTDYCSVMQYRTVKMYGGTL